VRPATKQECSEIIVYVRVRFWLRRLYAVQTAVAD
jgi:hypothetical protein